MTRLKLSILLITIISWLPLTAQENNPYSRFGLGDLRNQNFSGARGIGISSVYPGNAGYINYLNPSSYSSFGAPDKKVERFTRFEAAMYMNGIQVSTSNESTTTGNASLDYIALGMPLARNAGLAFGLVPVSRVQYGITDQVADTGLFTQDYTYEGSGGLYQAFIGAGYRVGDFSFGANGGYMFGVIRNTSTLTFPDLDIALGTRARNTTSFGNIIWNAGAQYDIHLAYNRDSVDNDVKLNPISTLSIGGRIQTEQSIKSESNRNWIRFDQSTFRTVDTVAAYSTTNTVNLPLQAAVGIAYTQDKKFSILAEYEFANWSTYQGIQDSDTLVNSNKVKLGSEIFLKSGLDEFTESVRLRLGIYYGNSHLKFGTTQLSEFGMTFGLGFPIISEVYSDLKIYNFIDLGFEVGQRGTLENDLIRENFYRASVALRLNYRWFNKTIYN